MSRSPRATRRERSANGSPGEAFSERAGRSAGSGALKKRERVAYIRERRKTRRQGTASRQPSSHIPPARPLFLCGWGRAGYRTADLLPELCEPFAIITDTIRPEWKETIERIATRYVDGDARAEASLHAAGIETA